MKYNHKNSSNHIYTGICWRVKTQFLNKNSSDLVAQLSHYVSTQSLPQTTDITL